jgi:hypothetical protein
MKTIQQNMSGLVERWVATTVGVAVVATLLWSGVTSVQVRRVAGGTETAAAPTPAATATPSGAPATLVDNGSSEPRGGRLHEAILSMTDADPHQGSWYVLDARAKQVHIVSANGDLVRTFAREGEGPGELSRPEALAVHYDTVVVAEQLGGVVHLYSLDGAFVEDRRIGPDGCGVTTTAGLASTPAGLAVLAICYEGGVVPEAKVILESGRAAGKVVASFDAEAEDKKIDPYFIPVIASHPNGLLAGLVGDDCLAVYALDGSVGERVCHQWISRIALSDVDLESLAALDERLRTMGRSLAEPDLMPGFDRVFVDAGGRAVYRAIVSSSPERFRPVTSTVDGEEEALDVPVAEYLFVGDNGILVGWEELEGTRVLLVPRARR